MTRGWSRWSGWVALLWAMAFFYLGVSSSPPLLVVTLAGIDLLGHAAASALLAILVAEWALVRRRSVRRAGLAGALGVSAGLGVLIEVLQAQAATRSFEAADLVADGVGAGLGVLLYTLAAARLPAPALSPLIVSVGLVAVAVAAVSVWLG